MTQNLRIKTFSEKVYKNCNYYGCLNEAKYFPISMGRELPLCKEHYNEYLKLKDIEKYSQYRYNNEKGQRVVFTGHKYKGVKLLDV